MVLIVKPSVEIFVHAPWSNEKDRTLYPVDFIEQAGRTAYQSFDKAGSGTAKKFVQMIKKNGHTSVLEHCVASAKIITDRGVMAELTRHRLASFTIESSRYCNYSKDKFHNEISVIEPPFKDKTNNAFNCWLAGVHKAEEEYKNMISLGESPEIARSVLPMCLKTEIFMTANFREWLHVIKIRTASDAHPQIREVMSMVKDELAKQIPEIFGE